MTGWSPTRSRSGRSRGSARRLDGLRRGGVRSCRSRGGRRVRRARSTRADSVEMLRCSGTPIVSAIAATTIAASVTLTRSTNHAPSWRSRAISAATLNVRRVLPTPPGPVTVTMRCSWRSPTPAPPCSALRPISGVTVDGQECSADLLRRPRRLFGVPGEASPVPVVELAQQGRNVTLDGAHRDAQRIGDLDVRQVAREQGQHLRLVCRHLRGPRRSDRRHRSSLLSVVRIRGDHGCDSGTQTFTMQP